MLLAASIPGVRPIFTKRAKLSTNYARREEGSADIRGDHRHDVVLKLTSLPTCRSKAYAARKSGQQSLESTENFLPTAGYGEILKTTEVDIISGESSSHASSSMRDIEARPSRSIRKDLLTKAARVM